MANVTRRSISFDPYLLKEFDKLIRHEDYENRSEAIRDLIRDYVHKKKENKVTATITLDYDYRKTDCSKKIADIKQKYHCLVKSSFSSYLGPHKCIHIILCYGVENRVKNLRRKFSFVNGVKECSIEILQQHK